MLRRHSPGCITTVVLLDLMETDPDLVTEMVTVLVQEGMLGNSQVKRVEPANYQLAFNR
nr:hypothetical protein [Tanacetum cinerariifolium]